MTIRVGRILLYQLIFVTILITSAVKSECINTMNFTDNFYLTDHKTYYYSCGKNSDKRQISITITSIKMDINDFFKYAIKSIQIECTNYIEPDYDKLIENISNVLPGTKDSFEVEIKRCSFPNVPFVKISRIFDTEPVTKFAFTDAYTGAHARTFEPYRFENLTSVQILSLASNKLETLPDGLFKNMLNLKELDLSGNNFRILPDKIFDPLEKLTSLNLNSNELTYIDGRIFQKLSSLTKLYLNNNNLDNLSRLTFNSLIRLESLELIGNGMTILNEGIFDNLENLNTLNLDTNQLTRVPQMPFLHNSKLMVIRLNGAFNKTNFQLPPKFFTGPISLEKLYLGSNKLTSLPEEIFQFNGRNRLETLDLGYNQLTTLGDNLFHNMSKLEDLKINHNMLRSIIQKSLADLKELQKLDLSHNQLTMNTITSDSPLVNCSNLIEINLSHNLLTKVHPDWRRSFNNLKKLDISYNQLECLAVEDFRFEINQSLPIIYYSYNNIKSINITGIEKSMRNSPTFHINNNPIKCDCTALILAEHLRKNENFCGVQIMAEDVKCNEPESLKNQSLKTVDLLDLKCHLHEIHPELKNSCPETCDCNYRPKDNVLEVNCTSREMTTFPKEIPITDYDVVLLFDGNNMTTIDEIFYLPEKVRNRTIHLSLSNNKLININGLTVLNGLKILKLDNNQLTSLDGQLYNHFNSLTNLTKITLQKNPWICNCITKNLWKLIHEDHHDKIPDKENIVCPGNHSIKSMEYNDFCVSAHNQNITIDGLSIVVVILVICAVISICCIYKYEIKVWMFAHKCCRWLVTEKEIDKGKKYDAFVSFSHEDKEFVEDHLIPKLEENNEENYKLCIHYRDFVPGEFIPEQITYSVENSRRTIVVLSPNFLKSSWSQLEWRTAHLQAVKDNYARVIIIMYEPVNIEDLDHELRAYITMNTYLEWGNKYFWNNLKFALDLPVPRRREHIRDVDMELLQETKIRL